MLLGLGPAPYVLTLAGRRGDTWQGWVTEGDSRSWSHAYTGEVMHRAACIHDLHAKHAIRNGTATSGNVLELTAAIVPTGRAGSCQGARYRKRPAPQPCNSVRKPSHTPVRTQAVQPIICHTVKAARPPHPAMPPVPQRTKLPLRALPGCSTWRLRMTAARPSPLSPQPSLPPVPGRLMNRKTSIELQAA